MATETTYRELIDLERYPIEDLSQAPARALIARCQADLEASGATVLDGFVKPAPLATVIDEVAPHLDDAFYKVKHHNPYLIADDPEQGEAHPRNRRLMTDSATLACDLIPKDCRLDRIYRWAPLHAFIADVLGFEELHPYADPLAALNILVYRPGSQTNWHFDNANFVVTLMLRQGTNGGAYQYAPFIRGGSDEFEKVGAVLDGAENGVLELKQDPGALVLFQGRNTLHRVTPVEGNISRLVAVFTYDPEPGKILAEHTRRTFYGRAA